MVHIRNRFITFPINAQLIFAPIFDRVTGEGLLQVDDTDAQQFSIKVSMHHYREVVSYPDPNVRKHYRLQYNIAYIGSGQQVEESCSWECNWNVR